MNESQVNELAMSLKILAEAIKYHADVVGYQADKDYQPGTEVSLSASVDVAQEELAEKLELVEKAAPVVPPAQPAPVVPPAQSAPVVPLVQPAPVNPPVQPAPVNPPAQPAPPAIPPAAVGSPYNDMASALATHYQTHGIKTLAIVAKYANGSQNPADIPAVSYQAVIDELGV